MKGSDLSLLSGDRTDSKWLYCTTFWLLAKSVIFLGAFHCGGRRDSAFGRFTLDAFINIFNISKRTKARQLTADISPQFLGFKKKSFKIEYRSFIFLLADLFQNSECSHFARCRTSFHSPVIVSVVDAVCVLHHGLRSKWPTIMMMAVGRVSQSEQRSCARRKNARNVNGNLAVLKSF